MTAILGGLFLLMVLFSRGSLRNNKPAWWVLIVIVVFAIHAQLDAYLYYNDLDNAWTGLSLLHYHLMGGLFLLFSYYLFRIPVNFRFWITIFLGYTLLRILAFIPEDDSVYENYSDDLSWTDLGIVLDNFISNLLNISCLRLAYLRIKALNFALKPEKEVLMRFLWLKNLLVFQIGLYLCLMGLTIVSFFFEEQWLTFWKLDSMVSGFFFFVLAFSAIRFPIFSMYGDFKDLAPEEKKYAKSSLSDESASLIWQEIDQVMSTEKLYLNPEFRLNELANRMGHSVHHISQVINQEKGVSFSDFLNALRIEEAQKLLRSDKAAQLTILAIAHEAGFNSKTAFYNAFKKFTGQTPSQFLKASK